MSILDQFYNREPEPEPEEEIEHVELDSTNSHLFRLSKVFSVKAKNEDIWITKDTFPYGDIRVHNDTIECFHRDIVKAERDAAMDFLTDLVYESMGYDEDYVRKAHIVINFINNKHSFVVRYGKTYPLVVAERIEEPNLLEG